MKRFKDPQWDAYGNCYAELLSYRLMRRLLEQTHRPWLWEGWEEASDSSSEQSVPQKPEPSVASATLKPSRPVAPAKPACVSADREQAGSDSVPCVLQQHRDVKEDVNKQDPEPETQKGTTSSQKDGANKDCQRDAGEKIEVKGRCTRRKINKSPQRTDLSKENQQPIVLYGCGEKKKDTGSQKTHNVFAPTQPHEIHESALRAKNRRQKEKRRQLLQRQRARSADDRTSLILDPDPLDNPWLTEYMRCYSARTR